MQTNIKPCQEFFEYVCICIHEMYSLISINRPYVRYKFITHARGYRIFNQADDRTIAKKQAPNTHSR